MQNEVEAGEVSEVVVGGEGTEVPGDVEVGVEVVESKSFLLIVAHTESIAL